MIMKTAGASLTFQNGVMRCLISGDIDHHSARAVRTQIDEEMLQKRPVRVVLDLSRVEFMDSSGLGLILGRFNRATEIGAEFVLLNPNENASRILDVAGIGRLIRIERKGEHK